MNFPSPSICVIVLTYKRLESLRRCVNSISSTATNSPFTVEIAIFNNDPENAITNDLFNSYPVNCSLRIFNRPVNIGVRQNVCRSLAESHADHRSDYYVFVTDDDSVLPNFFDCIYQKHLESCDAMISSCAILFEPDLASDDSALESNTYRSVPTRPYRDSSLQFILDSRLLSGTVYSSQLVDQYINYLGDSISRKEFMFKLWYPSAFISSFSKCPAFITTPIFIHAQGNETFWGDYDAFSEFFLGRLEMFAEMLTIGNINSQQHLKLVSDFVAHQQSLYRLFYAFTSSNFSPRLRLRILNRLFLVLILYRPAYLCSSAAKRLPAIAKRLLQF